MVTRRARALLAPQFRLSAHAAVSGQTAEAAGAGVVLHWAGARAEICPIRVDLTRSIALRPCALAEIGLLEARGERLADVLTRSRTWIATGGSLRATWESGRVFVTSGVSLIVPLRRDRFFAAPSTTFFEVPALGVAAGLAFGFVFLS